MSSGLTRRKFIRVAAHKATEVATEKAATSSRILSQIDDHFDTMGTAAGRPHIPMLFNQVEKLLDAFRRRVSNREK